MFIRLSQGHRKGKGQLRELQLRKSKQAKSFFKIYLILMVRRFVLLLVNKI
jgi:hypothetical protein